MAPDEFLRIATFLGAFSIIALWEVVAPRRALTTGKGRRWIANLSMIVIANLLARMIFPLLPAGLALLAQERGWGLLNLLPLPPAAAVIVTLLLLDLVIYLQHRLFHSLPLLWRLHRMHHSDLDLDASSASRFHPLEIVLSIGIKSAAILLFGLHPLGVLAFELLLNVSAIFNHGNIRLPIVFDRRLRALLVTPDMHRVHHSILPRETDSNFGFCLSWWDRLFCTYCPQPQAGHLKMIIGLKEFRDPVALTLPNLLIQPLITPEHLNR